MTRAEPPRRGDSPSVAAAPPDLADYHRLDRRCRSPLASAADFARRSACLDALGCPDVAERDRVRAVETAGHDTETLRWALRHGRGATERVEAAEAMVALDAAGPGDVLAALDVLFAAGDALVLRAGRRGHEIAGWVAWRGGPAPSVSLRFADGGTAVAPLASALGGPTRCRAAFAVRADPALSAEVVARIRGGPSRSVAVYPTSARRRTLPPASFPAAVTVILPVYGDPVSLEECLSALKPQCGPGIAVVAVDDAAPDPRVSALAREFCRAVGGRYLRSGVNAGFAASVNLGLEGCASGDALILNSDVILPPGAVGRLRAAARRSPGIGTVTPLSNDAGRASFPDPLGASPALTSAERARVDAAARAANDGLSVDLLAAHGSCLYLTRAGIDRAGPLSLKYGRGYYEDVELYLRAAEAGLRNVAACDLYVTHLGGRSFGASRGALVARNHEVLARRHPTFEDREALYDAADPLRAARGAIEERLGPEPSTDRVVVAPAFGFEPEIALRLRERSDGAGPALVLRHAAGRDGVLVALAASGAPWPRSLCFRLGGAGDAEARLAAYLRPIGGARAVVVEPERLPPRLADVLHGLGWPAASVAEGSAASARDGASRAGGAPPPARAGSGPPSGARGGAAAFAMIGVLAPSPDPAGERFALALARALRRGSTTHLLVIGRAIDEERARAPGNVWVTGPVESGEAADLARSYGVDALVCPRRPGPCEAFGALRGALGVPSACFGAAAAAEPRGLALDPAATDEAGARAVAAWAGSGA